MQDISKHNNHDNDNKGNDNEEDTTTTTKKREHNKMISNINDKGKAENNKNESKRKKRKNKKQKMKHHTWRQQQEEEEAEGSDHRHQQHNNSEEDDDDDNNSNDRGPGAARNLHPHEGSFANPAMREKFGITLAPHLLPPDRSLKETSETAGTTTTTTITNANGEKEEEEKKREPRAFSKKKVAFLLAYLGSDYAGFQINKEQRTLQAVFELALVKSELISPLNFGFPHKYSWSTSGRTDRGVHACAQVCSAKIQLLPHQTMDDARELINRHLPDDFRVLDVKRVARKFIAKTGRSQVRYQYMIPSFCFYERGALKNLFQEKAPPQTEGRHPSDPLSRDDVQEIQKHLLDYRVTKDQKEALQEALKQYEGTHSFHNFTKGVSSSEARASRYIVSFRVEDPIIVDGIEWIPTQVVGQSFLLHQIRKMVSLAVDTVRLSLDGTKCIQQALQKDSDIRTNLAPAQGLFLEMSFYDLYNQRQERSPNPADLDVLDWHSEETPAYHRWKTFRNEVIMTHVIKEEEKEGNFIKYLYGQEMYFEYANNYQLKNGEDN